MASSHKIRLREGQALLHFKRRGPLSYYYKERRSAAPCRICRWCRKCLFSSLADFLAKSKRIKSASGDEIAGFAGTGKTLVVVESPTKAKTIRKFLGKNYIVESCMGHIRDLPQSSKDIPEKFKKQKWAQLGVDTDHEFEPIYCVPKNKTKIVTLLKEKLKGVDHLLLATDEDREGESISWHLVETLRPQVPFRRMVFNEITEKAILEAVQDTREINSNLVRAQEARRILDRLVGYTISPLLWKKVAYGLSAGRVQSVAVRLIVEREHERIRFKKSSYWDLEAENEKDSIKFKSRLIAYEGKRVATEKILIQRPARSRPSERKIPSHSTKNELRVFLQL